MKKGIIGLIALGVLLLLSMIGFFLITENVTPGYVGYIYDRTLDPENPENNDVPVLEGTSVINQPRYGLVWINPFTQELYVAPTTIISRNWTKNKQEGSPTDQSIKAGTIEGKNVDVDIYLSVQPKDVGKIIKNWGVKRRFEDIVDEELYGVVKGEVKKVSRKISVYDFQAKVAEMQKEIFENLAEVLDTKYGISLVRFEFGNVDPPEEIVAEINKKTEAINKVELAELDAKRQAEINKKNVAQQQAESEKELIKRQAEADAAAYERKMAADAEAYEVERKAEARKKAAQDLFEAAVLEKEAELEKQKAYTDAYFRNLQMQVQLEAVRNINDKVKIIVTDESGAGIGSIPGIKAILDELTKN